MAEEGNDFSESGWESTPLDNDHDDPPAPVHSTTTTTADDAPPASHEDLSKGAVHNVQVKEAVIELEGTKDMFVSYLVVASTELPQFTSKNPASRRRFTDFTFLRDHLTRDYPTAVVPPLPDKHRMEYLTGDRFSAEFIERRRVDLQRFLERVARHPKLSRTAHFQNFLESTEWNIYKHQQLSTSVSSPSSSSDDAPPGLLDNLSDTLLNAFSKLRKPDARFLEIKSHLDQFEEGLTSIERLGARSKSRLSDLSGDYEDLGKSVQGLGYLESGITDSLKRFESALEVFGQGVKESSESTTDPFLEHLHSLLQYSTAFKSVLKLRDQKQLDFEELSSYLSNVTSERDRLAGGYGYGMGLGSYFKEKVESLRGGESDMSRAGKIGRLDVKIKELQDAVLNSHTTSQAFNEELLLEHAIFQRSQRIEMKSLLSGYVEGQIAMLKGTTRAWDKTIARITTDP